LLDVPLNEVLVKVSLLALNELTTSLVFYLDILVKLLDAAASYFADSNFFSLYRREMSWLSPVPP
jgi:hypothetical protein